MPVVEGLQESVFKHEMPAATNGVADTTRQGVQTARQEAVAGDAGPSAPAPANGTPLITNAHL